MNIAIPKGRLFNSVIGAFIQNCGDTPPIYERKYFYKDFFGKDINLFIAKPKAIPQLLESGLCDFGFCGYDIMMESMVDPSVVKEYADLDFNKIKIVIATEPNKDINSLDRPLICATEFPNIASKYLTDRNISHYILNTAGCTEGYSFIGADCIVDICETGETLGANGLVIRDTICESSTRLFGRTDAETKIPTCLQYLIPF